MMKTLPLIFIVLCLVSCKTPEAREPITVQSGSFIKESAERNKKLKAKEREYIERMLAKEKTAKYIIFQTKIF